MGRTCLLGKRLIVCVCLLCLLQQVQARGSRVRVTVISGGSGGSGGDNSGLAGWQIGLIVTGAILFISCLIGCCKGCAEGCDEGTSEAREEMAAEYYDNILRTGGARNNTMPAYNHADQGKPNMNPPPYDSLNAGHASPPPTISESVSKSSSE